MKRIRSEQIATSVNHYAKRRQFSDVSDASPQKKDRQSRHSIEEMALSISIISEGSCGNYISYSSISGDATACDQQYTKIKGFINEAVDPFRTELQPLLYPLFVHVYLELLCNGQKTPAHKFYSRHQGLFKNNGDARVILEDLQQMYNREDLESSKAVCEFRDHKYTILLSEEALQYLFRYLKNEDNVLMLQIFNQQIDIKVLGGSEINEDANHPEDRLTENLTPASPLCSPENKTIPDEVTLNSLRRSIQAVRDGPPCLSSVCMYTVLNAKQGMCSAHIAPDQSQICASFEDSTIQTWSLSPRLLHTETSGVNISRVHMSIDHPEDCAAKNSLTELPDTESVKLQGHSGAVYRAAFTNDNHNLLSVSEDTTVRLWDGRTHTNKAVYRGHNYPIWGLDVSDARGYFATCSHDRTAKLWCMDRLYPIRTFIGHMMDVNVVKFHPNCNYLASGSSDNAVRMWSLQDGQAVRLFHGHRAAPLALAFSPDGKYLASAGMDRRIKIWDLGTGTMYKDLRGHTNNIYTLSFNKESSVLASGGLDGTLRIWDFHKVISKEAQLNESHNSSELLGAFPTKTTVIHHMEYTNHNVLMVAGGSPS